MRGVPSPWRPPPPAAPHRGPVAPAGKMAGKESLFLVGQSLNAWPPLFPWAQSAQVKRENMPPENGNRKRRERDPVPPYGGKSSTEAIPSFSLCVVIAVCWVWNKTQAKP